MKVANTTIHYESDLFYLPIKKRAVDQSKISYKTYGVGTLNNPNT